MVGPGGKLILDAFDSDIGFIFVVSFGKGGMEFAMSADDGDESGDVGRSSSYVVVELPWLARWYRLAELGTASPSREGLLVLSFHNAMRTCLRYNTLGHLPSVC